MADTTEKRTQEAQDQARQAARSAAQGANEATQRSAAAGEQAGRTGAETLKSQAASTADAMRQSARSGADAISRAGAAAGETTRITADVAAEEQRRFVESTGARLEHFAQVVADAAQERAHDVRMMMALPNFSGEGFAEMQQGVQTLVEKTMQTNVRSMRALFQMADPARFITLQQNFMREYLQALFEGSAIMLRSARQAADQTLRPLEKQLEQRRRSQQAGQRVSDVMTRDVRIADPDDTVQQAARVMREEDVGVLPVGEGDRLVGMVTDRDLAVRLAAEGRDPARTKVRDVMTKDVRYVFEDEEIGHVAENMADQQVRRLPVVNRSKRVVGVVSLSDVAREGRFRSRAGAALGGIAQPGGEHTQTAAE